MCSRTKCCVWFSFANAPPTATLRRGAWRSSLRARFAPLSVFDEGVDLVLYFKRLMTLVGHDEYAHHLNDFDALSRSQESMAKRRFMTFRAWYASWPGAGTNRHAGHQFPYRGRAPRVIVDGGPPLGDGPLAERRTRFAREFDHFRRFAINRAARA